MRLPAVIVLCLVLLIPFTTRAKTLHDVSVWANSNNEGSNEANSNTASEADTRAMVQTLLNKLKAKQRRQQQAAKVATVAAETTSQPKFEVFIDPMNPSKVLVVDPALRPKVINLTTKKPPEKKKKPNIFQRGWAALKRGFRWMKNKIKEIFKGDDE